MTEAGWLAANDPVPMLEFIHGKVSDRKLRLFAVACCRRIEHAVEPDKLDDSRRALSIAERYADGGSTHQDLSDGWDAGSYCTRHEQPFRDVASEEIERVLTVPYQTFTVLAYVELERIEDPSNPEFTSPQSSPDLYAVLPKERAAIACLLRCIIGNPFRPVAFDSRWRSETAVALATGVYAERAFDRLPILADALEEAGCDHPAVLAHCRDPHQPHARGCWVVDLVLGKS